MKILNFEGVTDKLKDFLPSYLEEKGINTKGKFWCIHPLHDDSTPSANLVGDNRRIYCHGCLEAHEPVWTYNGLKPISEIQVGDKVLTHTGTYETVLAVDHKKGSLWEISTKAFRNKPLLLTPDHTCMVLRQEEAINKLPYISKEKDGIKFYKNRRTAKWRTQKYQQNLVIEECRADTVLVGDFILYPVSLTRSEDQDLVSTDCLHEYTKGPRTNRIKCLSANTQLAYIYGLYLAEGSTGPRHVTWSFHIDENNLATIVANTLKEYLGLSSNISRRPEKSLCEVVCSKTDLARQLEYWFGKGAENKKIPQTILETWSPSLKQALLQGYLDGDGTKNTNMSTTVSETLAYGLFRLGIQLGLIPSLSYKNAYIDKTSVYHQASWRINYLTREGRGGFYEKIGETTYYISEVKTSQFVDNTKTDVVDLHVQYFNSFVTKLGVVHNCGRYFDIFDAVHYLDNKPRTGLAWIENTFKWLANKYNVEVVMSEMTEEDSYKLDVHRAYQAACNIVSRGLGKETSQEVNSFLEQRGWLKASPGLMEWGVGTVKSFNDFQNELEDQGFTYEFLSEIKLLDPRIFNEKSLIFTWKDEAGSAVGFSARNTIWKKGDLTGKFINTATSGLKYNLFNKGGRLYGIEEALTAGGPTYIFEGQGDVTTARIAGLMNCVAISGTSFREDHVSLLQYLGLTDVILVLDGDKAGQGKTEEIIENKLVGQRNLKVRVVTLPADHDPDSYITKYGLNDFQELACWTAFEWRLNRYSPEEDEEKICEQMISVIATEPSAIAREKMIKTLSERTSVSFQSINAELNNLLDQKSLRRATGRMSVLQKIQMEMMKNPEEAEMIIHEGLTNLMDVSRQHSADVLGEDDFVKDLDEQKANEESTLNSSKWFKLGPDLKDMEETLRGEWIGTWFCFGGKANHGKTGLMTKLGMEIAKYNEDVVVIYHSIDDTTEQIVPRLVCLADGSKTITMNMVHQPTYWANTKGYSDLPMRRNEGYKIVKQNARDAKLVVKDISKGGSLAFAEALIAYYQDKYPNRYVIYMLDNFHKLTDYAHISDERVRMKALSTAVKSIALRRKCCMMSTVEYTKLPPGMKPNNNNIIETGQIEYDANVIFHVYNEKADTPDRFTVCHNATNWDGNPAMMPRVEIMVGKNKVTDLKDSFFLDFWPAMSDYSYVSNETVVIERKEMEAWRKGAGNEEPHSEIDGVFSCSN